MARIAGVDIPRNKRVEISLTYIYGIGRTTSHNILNQAEVNPDTRVRDLSEAEVTRLRQLVEKEHTVEGDLRREVAMNIKRLGEIGSYRGRPAHAHQFAHAQGAEENGGRARPAQGRQVVRVTSCELRVRVTLNSRLVSHIWRKDGTQ